MRKKRAVSKRLAAALAAHDKFLRSVGVDPASKPKLRGAVASPLASAGAARPEPTVKASDKVPGSGTARKPRPMTDLPIAQVYHKGPLMVVSNMSDLSGSKRRN